MNRIVRMALVWTGVVTLVGCATQPEDISAAYTSPNEFKDFNCDQIVVEMQAVTQRNAELYRSLKDEADTDTAQTAVGLLLFWPALFFLEGGDDERAAEYARLKGRYDTLESLAAVKNCDVPLDARRAKWGVQAAKAMQEETCNNPGAPMLLSQTAEREDIQMQCGDGSKHLVRCEDGKCTVL